MNDYICFDLSEKYLLNMIFHFSSHFPRSFFVFPQHGTFFHQPTVYIGLLPHTSSGDIPKEGTICSLIFYAITEGNEVWQNEKSEEIIWPSINFQSCYMLSSSDIPPEAHEHPTVAPSLPRIVSSIIQIVY